MSDNSQNIIQAEFFHNLPTRELIAADRLSSFEMPDLCRIKTVIRFYDSQNEITKFVTALHELELSHEFTVIKYLNNPNAAYSWNRMVLMFQEWKLHWLRNRKIPLLLKRLQPYIANGSPITIECSDYIFRTPDTGEVPRLLNAARSSKTVWIYIYSHADLHERSTELLVSCM